MAWQPRFYMLNICVIILDETDMRYIGVIILNCSTDMRNIGVIILDWDWYA